MENPIREKRQRRKRGVPTGNPLCILIIGFAFRPMADRSFYPSTGELIYHLFYTK